MRIFLQDPDIFSRCHNYERPNATALRCLHYPALPDTYGNAVKPVYNDHLYNNIYYMWFIQ